MAATAGRVRARRGGACSSRNAAMCCTLAGLAFSLLLITLWYTPIGPAGGVAPLLSASDGSMLRGELPGLQRAEGALPVPLPPPPSLPSLRGAAEARRFIAQATANVQGALVRMSRLVAVAAQDGAGRRPAAVAAAPSAVGAAPLAVASPAVAPAPVAVAERAVLPPPVGAAAAALEAGAGAAARGATGSECAAACSTAWEPCSAPASAAAQSVCGYPGVAFTGALESFVCPSMFRDLADFVWSFPFDHFKESDIRVAARDVAARCLPPIPVIYTQTESGHASSLTQWSHTLFKRPYILISGQSDYPNPSTMRAILSDSNLVRWYGQNADATHAKFTPLPIGLNCFEHAPEMAAVLDGFAAGAGFPAKREDKLALVNFGDTHPGRRVAETHFCAPPRSEWTSCTAESTTNNVAGNPHLKELYRSHVATHKYTIAPRGNGLDTHRVWEALYLRTVPVTLRSTIDAVFEGLPVLLVDRWSDVTAELLEREYPRLAAAFGPAGAGRLPQLTRRYWLDKIEAERRRALEEGGEKAARHRCWE